MYQPRPYQVQALRAVAKARKAGRKRTLVVMASGLGKTVVAGFDIRRFLRANPGNKVLYLCHQNDILRQAREELTENILPKKYSHGFMTGDDKDIHGVDILYASFQTMHRHKNRFKRTEFDFIVIDESHHGPAATYLPTIEYFRPKALLAVTATPERMDQQDITDIYGEAVFSLELEEAWARELLAPADYRVITDEWQNLKILETPVGKLSIKQLNKTIFATKRDEEIIRIIEEKIANIPNPRVAIFSPRISHSEHIASLMQGAQAIHSRLSGREQAERLAAFRRGEIRVVTTVDKFNEGIDVPEANVIVFLRSTASRTIFFQQLGRGLRLSEGKKQVLVLDFVANCDRLVILEDLRRGVRNELTHMKSVASSESPLVVDTGDFEFNEVARDVLEAILRIRMGYTEEVLIEGLRKVAKILGRTPKTIEVNSFAKKGICAASSTYSLRFGSMAAAIRAAGLQSRIFTKEKIVEQVLAYMNEIGVKKPTVRVLLQGSKAGRCPGLTAVYANFKSINELQIACGYGVTRLDVWTREDFLEFGKKLSRELSKPNLETIDLNRARSRSDLGPVPSLTSIRRHFGSLAAFNNALDLQQGRRARISDEELIGDLISLSHELGKSLTTKDVMAAFQEGKCAHYSTYHKRFGSLSNSLRAAGLQPAAKRRTSKYIPDAVMLEQLKALAVQLKRSPSVADVDSAGKRKECVSVGTLAKRFGTFNNAKLAAGLTAYPGGHRASDNDGSIERGT